MRRNILAMTAAMIFAGLLPQTSEARAPVVTPLLSTVKSIAPLKATPTIEAAKGRAPSTVYKLGITMPALRAKMKTMLHKRTGDGPNTRLLGFSRSPNGEINAMIGGSSAGRIVRFTKDGDGVKATVRSSLFRWRTTNNHVM